MEKVRQVRSLIFHLLLPLADSGVPSKSDLTQFNVEYRKISAKMKFVSTGRRYALACTAGDPVERIVCEAVRSTADLLLLGRWDRIRQCQGCGWLFFDSTRNRSRRWCTMKICGNRAKAHRHYQRIRQTRRPSIE